MGPYGLILRLDAAMCVQIISKALLPLKRVADGPPVSPLRRLLYDHICGIVIVIIKILLNQFVMDSFLHS